MQIFVVRMRGRRERGGDEGEGEGEEGKGTREEEKGRREGMEEKSCLLS